MAKAYKCDRCGNYFDKNKLHRENYFIRKVVGGEKTDIDLCESCKSKFQVWMDEFKVTSNDGDLVGDTFIYKS